MDQKTYIPVSCELHSELELAIMQGKNILLSWKDEDGLQQQKKLKPLDVFTKNHEEFLQANDDNHVITIRLDKIISIASAAV